MIDDFYEALGVRPEATEKEIIKAYRAKALVMHPDKNRSNPRAAEMFSALHRAKEVLLDPKARKAFDDLVRAREAKKRRESGMAGDRARMLRDLTAREAKQQQQRPGDDEKEARRRLEAEIERLRSEGHLKPSEGAEGDDLAERNPGSLKMTWPVDCSAIPTKSDIEKLLERWGKIEAVVISKKGSIVSFSDIDADPDEMIGKVSAESPDLRFAWVIAPTPRTRHKRSEPVAETVVAAAAAPSKSLVDFENEVFAKMREAAAAKRQKTQDSQH